MTDAVRWNGQMPGTRSPQQPQQQSSGGGGDNLADILERVLDKGIVIAGDIKINLLDIELLTIKIRLVVASVDRAKEMGIDWWERDPTLSSGYSQLEDENRRLRERLDRLENGHARAAIDDEPDGGDPEDAELVDDRDLEEVDLEDGEDADLEDAELVEDDPDDLVDDGPAGDPADEPVPEPAPRRRRARR